MYCQLPMFSPICRKRKKHVTGRHIISSGDDETDIDTAQVFGTNVSFERHELILGKKECTNIAHKSVSLESSIHCVLIIIYTYMKNFVKYCLYIS